MMAQKGMLPPDLADKPWKNGVVTFAAFIVFSSTPLLSFIILIPFTDNESTKFLGACLLFALALVIVGVAKAKIAGQNYAFSAAMNLFNGALAAAAMNLFNGALAAAAAYVLGWTLRNITGL
ncbi:Ccc1 family [Parasponia andersonii]|uniref:Vacuolar iron transporter n=1 Tax=Parasponia andersonii TaxID=3476 RepID=A0A2P5E1F3_PARAD|nr:Ccc1 family [Parasponia andersonii]